ncbi:peptidoglycan-binding domain-containing protein, partial [Acidisphaera rubrifaciens]|uniref:peptidoglycan-binding domain-containing protein n=1 Tax=Acidisphaera rubrifaciens TaxID=50715 RepID=UPI0019D6B577
PPGGQPGMGAPPPGQPAAEHRSPVPLSRDALRLIQSRLREQGFYFGGIDGVWGPGSQSALVHLQQARGIPVSGRIDAASVQALGFDPNNFPPQ